MGALTLKNFPFILRDWDVQSYDSIDPTDSFGQNTNVYLNKNQIIKIEPQFSDTNSNIWLTDKGRQFFDSLFTHLNKNNNETQPILIQKKIKQSLKKLFRPEITYTKTEEQWETLFKTIIKITYIFDICNFKNAYKYFFILIFENIDLEALNLLYLLSQTYSFIKLRRAENLKTNTNLEASLQINSGTCISKLSSSSLCLLIATDTRYEGSYINLKLRQRYFKGSFKVLSIGSLKYLTFPVFFLGSSTSILKTITEGNHVVCLDIINSNNPLIITNTEILKRKDIQHTINIIKILKHTNVINNIWNGFNMLNSSLTETGINNFSSFSFLTFKDLLFFNSFYIINVNNNNVKNLKKITESRLLALTIFFYNYKEKTILKNNRIFITQDHNRRSKNFENFLIFKKYLYLPNNNLFENNETFLNTEGLIKKTTKLIFKKKTKNNWKLIRKFTLNTDLIFFINNIKDKKLIFFNNKNFSYFKNFTFFQFYSTKSLTNLNDFLNDKNKSFVIYKKFSNFKKRSIKIFNTKTKYWLDDFFIGSKDRFCQDSLTMIHCSKSLKSSTNNYFWMHKLAFVHPDVLILMFINTSTDPQLIPTALITLITVIGFGWLSIIWLNPRYAPNYTGEPLNNPPYTGCKNYPDDCPQGMCKLKSEVQNKRIPGRQCDCILPQGSQNVSELNLQMYSNTAEVKKIRKLQADAEHLKWRPLPNAPEVILRQHYRDENRTNQRLSEALLDFQAKLEGQFVQEKNILKIKLLELESGPLPLPEDFDPTFCCDHFLDLWLKRGSR